MTYCVAIKTDSGLVFASDSLTNAGIDHVSTYSVGEISADVQRAQTLRDTANTNFEATFIVGGQIVGQAPEVFMIYAQGNHIHESAAHPYLQIGETKYGKPILDRVIRHSTPIEQAARCALVSINSTIRSNLTVGPPVELLIVRADALDGGRRLLLTEDHPYYRALGDAWNEGLRQALNNLPPFEWENQPQPLQVVAANHNTQMQG
jgi:putative proteasome-type protease